MYIKLKTMRKNKFLSETLRKQVSSAILELDSSKPRPTRHTRNAAKKSNTKINLEDLPFCFSTHCPLFSQIFCCLEQMTNLINFT